VRFIVLEQDRQKDNEREREIERERDRERDDVGGINGTVSREKWGSPKVIRVR
jgi:hypothetical protein